MDGAKHKDEPVTIDAPPAASVTVDPQNPLPEPSFKWRRVLAYLVVAASLALTWHAVEVFHDLGAADQLLTLSQWVIGFATLIATYYYIAPSAAELTGMIQSARIIKSSLFMAGEARKDDKNAASRPGEGVGERFRGSAPQDSRFPDDALSGLENGSQGDSDEADYAPRGR